MNAIETNKLTKTYGASIIGYVKYSKKDIRA